jgi:class 3 adenylate cyclase
MLTGAVIGNNIEPMLIMEYMDHGSLYDLLHNETMVIEGELLLPVLRDISQGVRFLHSATPQVLHGDLKAQNILVDSKFRAKVADFGLSQKKNMGGTGTPFWMAPELLRGESSNTAATDVYSFGIILYEVYSRRNPYESEDPVEVLRLVADKLVRKRPPIPKHCPPQVQSLMVDCLVDEADMRPSFEELDIRLKRVEVKDVDADKSSKKAASISLFDIFPRHIAEALRDGRTVEPEHRDVVTIFFSDIIGFTDISSDLPPRKVADMLDRLYTKLDALSGKYDVFKVETIGDAYMAVTNLVKDQPLDHVKRIANFAIDAVKAANGTYIDLEDHNKGFVSMRVGFHSGSVVADVVGTRNPRYCLFGDTVNTASRMESYSKANRIHCSSAAADILMEECPELPLKSRGLIYIKGKGEMHTFWVNEEGKGRQSITQELTDAEKSMLNWVGSKEPKMEMLKEESLPERSSELIPEDHAADSHDIEAATRASQ